MMLKNGQTYFKTFAVLTRQDFCSPFGHFLTLFMKIPHELTEFYFQLDDSPEFQAPGPRNEILFYQ